MRQEEIDRLEKERKLIYLLNIIIGILVAIDLFVFFINFKNITSHSEEPFAVSIFPPTFEMLFAITIAIIILAFVSQYLKKSLNNKISELIYSPAFKEKNARFNYDDGLTLEEVASSKLFQYPDRFGSNSLIEGVISGFPYKASNITLIEEHEETDSDGHTHTSTKVIFDGRMYIIETPFYKKGIILKSKKIGKEKLLNIAVTSIIILIAVGLITHNLLMPMFSDPYFKEGVVEFFKENLLFFIGFTLITILTIISPILSNRKKGYKKAKLESDQFNKYFDIETQDQVELRKTLTPAVMEKLLNLRNSIGEYHLSIIGDKIFFAFPKSFAIKYNKPIQELIEEAKESADEEIETIKSIIETLKLEEERIKKGYLVE